MVIEAERAPTNAGAKVTEMVQLAPAATLLPHVLVWLKSEALVPSTAVHITDNESQPQFESWLVCATVLAAAAPRSLSLHDALPICARATQSRCVRRTCRAVGDGDRSGASSHQCRGEGHRNRATRSGRDAACARVGLVEIGCVGS